SLFSILREKYYINPAWTEVEMEALAATAEEAYHLKINRDDPVLVVKGLTFTDSFELIESVRTVYRGNGLALYIGRQRISTFSR
ncbi:MAG TPA: UTRA domain-containing protein, partial [Anaerolineales bacterium]